jgi:predicted DCC family thiol-disulfide oxidoreductase YuxK
MTDWGHGSLKGMTHENCHHGRYRIHYDFVAQNRYRVFGKSEACMLPDPAYKHKFLEV